MWPGTSNSDAATKLQRASLALLCRWAEKDANCLCSSHMEQFRATCKQTQEHYGHQMQMSHQNAKGAYIALSGSTSFNLAASSSEDRRVDCDLIIQSYT